MIIDSKNFFTIISVIGAVLGLGFLVLDRHRLFRILRESRFLYIGLGFLIPIVIASVDSPDFSKSFAVFTRMFLYLLIGVLAIVMLQNYDSYFRLTIITFFILLIISIDAILQWLTGYHLLGYHPVLGNRVVGIFGEHRYHLSYFLGTFSPILLFVLYTFFNQKRSIGRLLFSLSALSLMTFAVIIGGARAGMISMAVSLVLFIGYLFASGKVRYKWRFLGGIILLIFIIVMIASQSELVQSRFITTTYAFGTNDFFKVFSAGRSNIWYVAINELPNHWLNGMGPRAFNTFYQLYPENYKIFPLVWHPHLHGLEILIETGIIGFIPYILICCYLLYRMFTAKAGNMWLMMGFVAIMPINSHVGLYQDYYWIPLFWVPIMLGLIQAYFADNKCSYRS